MRQLCATAQHDAAQQTTTAIATVPISAASCALFAVATPTALTSAVEAKGVLKSGMPGTARHVVQRAAAVDVDVRMLFRVSLVIYIPALERRMRLHAKNRERPRHGTTVPTTSDETITLKLKVDRKPGASSPSDAR